MASGGKGSGCGVLLIILVGAVVFTAKMGQGGADAKTAAIWAAWIVGGLVVMATTYLTDQRRIGAKERHDG